MSSGVVSPPDRHRSLQWVIAGLVIFMILYSAAHLYWCVLDNQPPANDEIVHLRNSNNCLRILLHPREANRLESLIWLDRGNAYPPLLYLAAVPWYAAIDNGFVWARASLLVFHLVLIAASFGLARRLWGPSAGLLAALVVSTSPMILDLGHLYYTDPPLAALVMLALYLLISSAGLRRAWSSLGFGIVLGLAMLTKWSALVFVAGALLWMLLPQEKPAGTVFSPQPEARGQTSRESWRAFIITMALFMLIGWLWVSPDPLALHARALILALSGLASQRPFPVLITWWVFWIGITIYGLRIALHNRSCAGSRLTALAALALVAGPWYLFNLPNLYRHAHATLAMAPSEGNLPPWSLPALLFYPCNMLASQIFLPFALLLAFGLVITFRDREAWRRNAPLVLTSLVGTLFFVLLPDKEARYILPMVPVAGILMTFWIPTWKTARVIIAFLVLTCLFQWGAWPWFIKSSPQRPPVLALFHIPLPPICINTIRSFQPVYLARPLLPWLAVCRPPDRRVWPWKRLMDDLENARGGQETQLVLVRPPGWHGVQANLFRYLADLRGLPYRFAEADAADPRVRGFDSILVITTESGSPAVTGILESSLAASAWRCLGNYRLPDGPCCRLYLRPDDTREGQIPP